MNNVIYKCFALCCYFLLSSVCYSQMIYRFRSWDQQEGMPSNNCISVMQDQREYLWLATVNGVSRFNGVHFQEMWKHGFPVSIEGEVRQVIQDKAGVYWICSYEKGLISIDLKKNKEEQVKIYNPTTLPGQECPPVQSMNRILDDDKGNIWVATESNGLYRFDKRAGSYSNWSLANPFSSYSNHIRCLFQENNGTVWVGMVNGIAQIDPVTGKTSYPNISYTGIQYPYPPTVRGICHWNKDTFAFATDRGAYLYLNHAQVLIPVFPLKDSLRLKKEEYHHVIKATEDELWFATIDKGIWHANIRKGFYLYSWENDTLGESVGKHPVYFFYKDKRCNIWVAHSKGLSYFNKGNHAVFMNVPVAFGVNQPPSKNFLVSGKGKLAFIRPDSVFISSLPSSKNNFNRPFLKVKSGGGKQVLWHERFGFVIINDRGIFYIDTLKSLPIQLISRNEMPSELQKNSINAQIIADTIDGKEYMWLSSNESTKLYRYDWQEKRFDNFQPARKARNFEIKGNYIFSVMIKDPANGIWIGTKGQGLYYMPDRNSDHFIHYTFDASPTSTFAGNYIEDLKLDKRGTMWATVRNVGLVAVSWQNPSNLKFNIYAKEHGLTYLNLGQIQIDHKNNLWISSANGLHYFDQVKKWFTGFGQSSGISNPTFTMSSTMDDAGNLYFPSTDYLLYFDPRDAESIKSESSLVLRSLTANGKVFNLMHLDKLVLNPNENAIEFEFDILDYDKPTGHYIYCKLVGHDQEWQLLQDVYRKGYQSLAGGEYLFKIKKILGDGSSEKEISFPVIIEKHLYEKAWFRIILLLVVFTTIYLVLKEIMFRKLLKERRKLEKKQAVELERMRISMDLHDDIGGELSTIRLVSEMAQMNPPKNSSQQFSSISASSGELLQKMNEIIWALNVNNDTLQSLVSYIHRYSVKFLNDANMTCSFKQPEAIAFKEIDGTVRRNIFLMVKEGLHNIIKHSYASHVDMIIEVNAHSLIIEIRDNGKGLSKDEMNYSQGNGFFTMEKRVRDINGTLSIRSDGGTILSFVIPIS